MQRDETIKCLAEHLRELRSQYNVSQLSIFGSIARDQGTETSDVDLLVEFSQTPGLFEFIELKNHLESLLGAPVDLVTRKALKPQLSQTILSEAIRVC